MAKIGLDILNRLEHIHAKGLVHRNLNPENILIGINKRENDLFLINFAKAKRYIDPKTNEHISYRKDLIYPFLTRGEQFQSMRGSLGHQQSRRDDLEALGYVLAYLLNEGQLPWSVSEEPKPSSSHDISEETIRLNLSPYPTPQDMGKKKYFITFDTIFSCSSQREHYVQYMKYCRDLPFEEEPNYRYLNGLFRKVIYFFQISTSGYGCDKLQNQTKKDIDEEEYEGDGQGTSACVI